MSTLLRQADDKFDRVNEQQTRTVINTRVGDQESKTQRKTTSRGGISTYQGKITLANGANNNISLDYATYVYIIGPTGSFSISGIKNGEKGAFVILRNNTAQQMTITHEGASSSANNRIWTPNAADLVLGASTKGQTVVLQYDTNNDRWMVISALSALQASWASIARATGFDTFVATPSSANLRALLTDESGSGAALFQSGDLGTPSAGVLTSCTGLPISTGVSGLGTGIATALAVNVGTDGAPVVKAGALGTPSGGTLTNCTGLPISTGVSGLGSGVATFLATPSSANFASAITDEEGTGAVALEVASTWTPALAFGGASTGITYTTQSGTYIKIGRVIFWSFHILLTSKGSATGSATITGFPFTAVNDAGEGSAIFTASVSTASGMYFSPQGAAALNVRLPGASATSNAADTNFTNTSEIFASGWARTTA